MQKISSLDQVCDRAATYARTIHAIPQRIDIQQTIKYKIADKIIHFIRNNNKYSIIYNDKEYKLDNLNDVEVYLTDFFIKEHEKQEFATKEEIETIIDVLNKLFLETDLLQYTICVREKNGLFIIYAKHKQYFVFNAVDIVELVAQFNMKARYTCDIQQSMGDLDGVIRNIIGSQSKTPLFMPIKKKIDYLIQKNGKETKLHFRVFDFGHVLCYGKKIYVAHNLDEFKSALDQIKRELGIN